MAVENSDTSKENTERKTREYKNIDRHLILIKKPTDSGRRNIQPDKPNVLL